MRDNGLPHLTQYSIFPGKDLVQQCTLVYVTLNSNENFLRVGEVVVI